MYEHIVKFLKEFILKNYKLTKDEQITFDRNFKRFDDILKKSNSMTDILLKDELIKGVDIDLTNHILAYDENKEIISSTENYNYIIKQIKWLWEKSWTYFHIVVNFWLKNWKKEENLFLKLSWEFSSAYDSLTIYNVGIVEPKNEKDFEYTTLYSSDNGLGEKWLKNNVEIYKKELNNFLINLEYLSFLYKKEYFINFYKFCEKEKWKDENYYNKKIQDAKSFLNKIDEKLISLKNKTIFDWKNILNIINEIWKIENLNFVDFMDYYINSIIEFSKNIKNNNQLNYINPIIDNSLYDYKIEKEFWWEEWDWEEYYIVIKRTNDKDKTETLFQIPWYYSSWNWVSYTGEVKIVERNIVDVIIYQ